MIRALLLCLLLPGSLLLAFDHEYTAYGNTLDRYVEDGEVDYRGLLNDREGIDGLMNDAAQLSFEEYQSFSRARQMAFMINLYNAAAIQLILDHYPVESIRDLGGFLRSVWNKKFIDIFEHTVGLGHIEHDILRPEFDEPRIHFAIVCAALSCPHLRSEPYLAEKLDAQLSEQERAFFMERPLVNFFEEDALYLSPILKWFADDFGGRDGVRTLASHYIPGINERTRIFYSDYNWSLNSKEPVHK